MVDLSSLTSPSLKDKWMRFSYLCLCLGLSTVTPHRKTAGFCLVCFFCQAKMGLWEVTTHINLYTFKTKSRCHLTEQRSMCFPVISGYLKSKSVFYAQVNETPQNNFVTLMAIFV